MKLNHEELKIRNTKFLISNLLILIVLSCSGALCPIDISQQLKQVADLKEELYNLQKQLDDKLDLRAQLQKDIANKDAKIKEYQRQIEEIKKRCP